MAKPEKKFKAGNCSAAVFVNEIQTKNGKAEIRSVSLQKTYKDQQGNFQNTASFGVADIPKAMLALSKAYEHLVLDEKGE